MITYVTPDPPFNGQDAPLTALQHDTNIKTLADDLVELETAFAAGVTLEDPYITSAGNIVTFHLSNDNTIDAAFNFPAFVYRGAWLNDTAYAVGNIFTVAGTGVFLVLEPHTTPALPAEFDPEATTEDTDADPLYGLLLPEPDFTRVMKWQGDSFPAEQNLAVWDIFKDATYGLFIVNIAHFSAETFDPYAVDEDDQRLYTQIAPPTFPPVEVATVTGGTYTVTPADAGKYLSFEEAAEIIFVEDEDFPDHAEIHFERASSGVLLFSSDTDTEIIPQREGFDTAAPYQGAVITAKRKAAATWKLIGPHGDELTA